MSQPILTTTIRLLRLQANMTQEELGERVGVARQTIAYLEKGQYMPSLALAWRIARIFNQPIEEVFNYSNHE